MKTRFRVLIVLCIIFGLGSIFTGLRVYTAGSRVLAEHKDLMGSHGDRLKGLTLNFRKSFLPVLKRPRRTDIRLYYYAKFNSPFTDYRTDVAWAIRGESGEWDLKVYE